jgi:predicted nucleic acid-binding protein
MTGRLFFDTNLLVYALDPAEPTKRARAAELLRAVIVRGALIVSPQILNECYRVVTDKRRLLPKEAAQAYIGELVPFCLAPLDATTTQLAFDVQERLGLSWWDSLVVASAIQGGADTLLSEDIAGRHDRTPLRFLDPFTAPIDHILS